jgi:hypothetical protein
VSFEVALGGQHPVERVTEPMRVATGAETVKVTHRQVTEAVGRDQLRVPVGDIGNAGQLPQALLGGYLPRRGGAHQHLVGLIGNRAPRRRRQPVIVREPPQPGPRRWTAFSADPTTDMWCVPV